MSRTQRERDGISSLLRLSMEELGRQQSALSLSSYVSSEDISRGQLSEIIAREEEIAREVTAVATSIREEEESHSADMEERKRLLADLKAQLMKVRQETVLSMRYARKEAAARGEAINKAGADDAAALSKQITAVDALIEREKVVHAISIEAMTSGECNMYTFTYDVYTPSARRRVRNETNTVRCMLALAIG